MQIEELVITFAKLGEPSVAAKALPVGTPLVPTPCAACILNEAFGAQLRGWTLPSSLNLSGLNMWPPQAIRGPPASSGQFKSRISRLLYLRTDVECHTYVISPVVGLVIGSIPSTCP
jgi:hypothetical protein